MELFQDQPTSGHPLLAGILIDVSASMVSSSLRSEPGGAPRDGSQPGVTTRIQSVSRALDDLVARGAEHSRQGSTGTIAPLLKLFMYGFGFGGALSTVLSALFGSKGEKPKVRDLLALPGESSSTVGIDQLAQRWLEYRRNVESMLPDMLGDTPMASAMRTAQGRFARELSTAAYAPNPMLLIISDGEPTPEEGISNPAATVREVAREMKAAGVTIISCLLTKDDIAQPRRLYASADPSWPAGASLLFDCASEIPPSSPFHYLLSEFNWSLDHGARLFAQINHTDVLSEFSKLVLSRLPSSSAIADSQQQAISPSSPASAPRPVRVFVSYSHRDSRYVKNGDLLDYLSGLKNDNVEFWWDERIETGEAWDERIRTEIANTDIALVLVSQAFLNSQYCQNVEIRAFLEARKANGLRIFPVILSPCDWQSYAWLSATQVQPRRGTVETEYTNKGKRAELYLAILNELRAIAAPKADLR
jgi:TIR domain